MENRIVKFRSKESGTLNLLDWIAFYKLEGDVIERGKEQREMFSFLVWKKK